MKVIEQVLHVGIALQIDIRIRVSVACQEFLDAKRIGGMIRAYEVASPMLVPITRRDAE